MHIAMSTIIHRHICKLKNTAMCAYVKILHLHKYVTAVATILVRDVVVINLQCKQMVTVKLKTDSAI